VPAGAVRAAWGELLAGHRRRAGDGDPGRSDHHGAGGDAARTTPREPLRDGSATVRRAREGGVIGHVWLPARAIRPISGLSIDQRVAAARALGAITPGAPAL